ASGAELSPIPLLDAIQDEGGTWEELAPRHGVANPDPPWKVSLYAIFECLSAGGALPSLERRHIEDRLGETLYGRTPDPERQLLPTRVLPIADVARRPAGTDAEFFHLGAGVAKKGMAMRLARIDDRLGHLEKRGEELAARGGGTAELAEAGFDVAAAEMGKQG